jgi:hypothetical protein
MRAATRKNGMRKADRVVRRGAPAQWAFSGFRGGVGGHLAAVTIAGSVSCCKP